MTKINSTAPSRPRKPRKPKKPHKDFPLTPHPSGRWCKKVKGKLHYFGPWADPDAALTRWLDEKDDLLAGRIPRAQRIASGDAVILNELVGKFLDAKKARMEIGELSPHTWQAYHAICAELVKAFGKDRLISDILPEDFGELYSTWAKSGSQAGGKGRKWGAERLAAETRRARTVFAFAFKTKLVKTPIDFGEGFNPPSKKNMRLNRAARGPKMFEAAELRKMIEGATQPLKAMLLLAINAGLGNNDVAQLPLTALDLDAGWVNFPRPKTGMMRRCPLWPETVAAAREWLTVRPMHKIESAAQLMFLTVRGDGWGTNIKDRPITHACRKLLDTLQIGGNRNFYGIRHTFETIAGDSKDQVAVDAIMGHDDGSMAAIYRDKTRGISNERLRAVAEHVRRWLFAVEAPKLKIAEEVA